MNLPRLNKNVKFVIDNPFKPQPIFDFIQENGKIEDKEMYQTFNMGMGMAIIVPPEIVDESTKILRKHTKSEVKIVGEVIQGKGVELIDKGIIFQ